MKQKAKCLLKTEIGFTKLQNLMITAIILILVLVGGVAFNGFNRSSYQIKATNTVRRIYESASEYLEGLERTDKLEEFNRKASHFGGLVTMDLQNKILSSRYERKDFEEFFTAYEEAFADVPIRYISMESASLKNEEREENPILDILEYQVLDENIIKHTFLIEYNGNTGEVLAVLYSEKTDSFTYEGNLSDKSNAILRDSESLNQKWQGYFGKNPEE